MTIEEVLSPDHLALFIVLIIAQLDLSAIYAHYAPVGGVPFAPEVLLGILFYGYATGLFSSWKLEKATYESIPFRDLAGGLHPDHNTIANFRKTFLSEIKALFAQVLLIAQEAGAFQLGNTPPGGRCQGQSGWQQDSRRCLQESCRQLPASARTRKTTPTRSGGTVCSRRTG